MLKRTVEFKVRGLTDVMRIFATLIATAFIADCATAGELTRVFVERIHSGRGSSPAYTVAVERDGSVRYEGLSNVKVQGAAAGSVSAADWKLLELAVEGTGFFAMKGHYGSSSVGCTSTWNHHPMINITVTRRETSKRVSYYTGCWGLREGKLISWLANTTDMVAGSGKWVYETIEDDL